MQSILPRLLDDRTSIRVGGVTLAAGDDLQSIREKLARIVLDEMYQFVGLLDADGMTLEINRAALEGAGLRIQDVVGKPFWEARWFQVSQDVIEAQREYVRRAQSGEFIRCDTEVYGSAGGEETIVVDFSLLPVRDERGRVVFLLAEGRNITEKKRAEAEVARKNAELQTLLDRIRQLDRLKSDLFANVSHELRTPLSLILGPVEELLASGDALTDEQRRNLRIIQRNAATLLKHVNDLLELARRDAQKLSLDYSRVDLAATFRLVAEQFQVLAPQRSITYVVDAPRRLVAEVDPAKLERVVLNLLSNAFKFTPAGGRIRCALGATGLNRALITVQDSGPGIPAAMREAVFERFQQVQTGTTREHGGTGLGLAIARELVMLHGGTIAVSAAPGGGSLFQVEFPLHAPAGNTVTVVAEPAVRSAADLEGTLAELAEPADDGQAAVGIDAGQRYRASTVLVVEDNPEMRRFVCDALSSEHHVVAVGDGEQALERMMRLAPDLVVTDLMMPRMGGDRLVSAMRAQPTLADIPVLVLSAKDDEALRARLLADSVQDYVAKPFPAQELRARVRNLTTMKLARDALRRELASQSDDLRQLMQELIDNRRALQRSEQQWAAMFEHSPVGILLADEDGRIRSANPAFRAILGYDEPALREMTLPRIMPVEDRAPAQARLAPVAAGEVREHHGRLRFQRRDGGLVCADVGVAGVPRGPGERPLLVVVAEDITERLRAEEALGNARDELARVTRVSTLGELAASIAHEVNQPLAAIVANGQACLRWMNAQPADEQEARAAVSRIIRDANHASEVISRVRRFLRQGPLQRERVHLAEVIDEVLELVRREAQGCGAALRLRHPDDLPDVAVDRVQIQQVLLNLVMNALESIQAGPPGGHSVEIATTVVGDEAIRIDVRDSGIGIDARHIDRVFDAFHTTKPGGMGMGLAISRSIVEAHGGRLWVASNEGAGVTFSFTLPCDDADPQDTHVE